MLDIFWDRAGNVLFIAPKPDQEFDLVQLEAQRRGGASLLLGYGSLRMNQLGFVVFALPEVPEEQELRLLLQAFPAASRHPGTAAGQSHARTILLANRAASERSEASLWTVDEHDQAGLRPYTFNQQEPAPPRPVSSLWTSHSEGNTLYPATRGGEANARPLVRISARSRREEDGEIVSPPVFGLEFTSEPSQPLQQEIVLTVYSLSAVADVLPLLTGTRGHFVRRNHETHVRLAPGRTARASLPADTRGGVDVPVWAEEEAEEPGTPRVGDAIDFLDRIVVEAQIPVSYELQLDGGIPKLLENHGTCALIYLGDGRLLEDAGGLVNRMQPASDGKLGLDLFLRAMELNEFYISSTDAEAASEILVLAGALTSKCIEEVYGSTGVRLRAHETRDYLETPAYFGLVSATEGTDSIGVFTQELARFGAGLPEAEKAGRFARFRLLEGARFDADAAGRKRIESFANQKIEDGEGWDIVPLIVREDVRRAVATGLVWDGFDIGSLIDFLGRPGNEPAMAELAALNDLLTDLGALRLEFDAQFTTPPGLAQRLATLNELCDEIVNLVVQSERTLELVSGDDPVGAGRGELLRQVLAQNKAPLHGFARQALDYFRKGILPIVRMNLSTGLSSDAETLADRISGHFLHRILRDCDMIDRIVATGYSNPLGHPATMSFGEGAATFETASRRPLGQEQQEWLYAEDRSPPLVQRWRNDIRADYEAYNKLTRSDRT